MGPKLETCTELLRPLRAMLGLKQFAMQRGQFTADHVPYAAAGLLTELVLRGECRASDLAHHRIVDASVVSRQVGQLEQAGLITRRHDPADRRVVLLRATPDGERAVAELERRKAEWIRDALAHWDDAKVRELAGLLGEAMDDIRRYTIKDGGCVAGPVTKEGTR
ncbi:MarR family winged helix-turn-helix transcriptional regulator [Saccharopolyspora phatthalungensis]|uniref:DNA-binding MarR family transcriptional regulator n=1 Tax=Saccharopolyspora phatthalungensis TaxID=664693 RepID=A0A840Q3A2_9PSEU|nr:MarR family winged helix-turn-helix transcriptional regulator [Saccharopolyspora phatthalungensis]MBB5154467.1 DNA-binding MarR family transcriptional regulator [Saccharopolyspora phatthalungensis]